MNDYFSSRCKRCIDEQILLDYYKAIDIEGALFYWNEFDKNDE